MCGTGRNYETLELYFKAVEMLDACDNLLEKVKPKV